MKQFLFRGINLVGNALSHRQRRFLLDELGLGRLFNRMIPDDFVELILPNGIRLTANRLLHGNLAKSGEVFYEKDVCGIIEDHLGEGDVFYDIGANIGVFSFIAAKLVGTQGEVHAFEPEKNNTLCFRRTMDNTELRNIVLHECAVGANNGTMKFDRRGGAFSGRLLKGEELQRSEAVEVQVCTIDQLLADGVRSPTLIKIDVEGGEGDVLEGTMRLLKQGTVKILCEMHPDNPDGIARAFNALHTAGYICRELQGMAEVSVPKDSKTTYHVLATPNNSKPR